MSEKWFYTDTGSHFADSCYFLQQQTESYISDQRAFPWVIFASANLVQSACVFFLMERSSNSLPALTKKNAKAWMLAYEASDFSNYKGAFLEYPRELLEKVDQTNELGKSFADSNEISRCLSLRNQYVHFTPKSASVELSGVPSIIKEVCRLGLLVCHTPGMYRLPRSWDNCSKSAQNHLEHIRTIIGRE